MKEKQIFESHNAERATLLAKQEFHAGSFTIEANEETQSEDVPQALAKPISRKLRWLGALAAFFMIAVIAQGVQWCYEAVVGKAWISLAFSLVFLAISLLGAGALLNELRQLRWLRAHQNQQSETTQQALFALPSGDPNVQHFCDTLAAQLPPTPENQRAIQAWQAQHQPSYNGKETCTVFSRTVLAPIDTQAKKLIRQQALENALLVTISPLAIADMLFVAWRNLRLVNQIARLYGVRLGYVSRLMLFKSVLKNVAFTGAAELISDLGTELLSSQLLARLSLRAAQGAGVGILTARLGIQAIYFSRPLAFQAEEKPRLRELKQHLLEGLTNQLRRKSPETTEDFAPENAASRTSHRG